MNLQCVTRIVVLLLVCGSTGNARALVASDQTSDAKKAPRIPEIIAHRGASHDAPENTLLALRLGFEQASEVGELDVWVSRDGVPVVIHDADTKRVAGEPRKVADQTLAELQQLDVGKWKSPSFADARIPTLAEALRIIPPGRRMFVEIKCGLEGVPPILEAITASKLPSRQIEVISFNADVVAEVKRRRSDLRAYWIVSLKPNKAGKVPAIVDLIEKARAIRADGLDLSSSPEITADAVRQVRSANLRFYVWTVDDAQDARRLADLGVDGITTNRPGWLREQLLAPAQAVGN
jgi:glycerophosphoryl diester phosphodiesterase